MQFFLASLCFFAVCTQIAYSKQYTKNFTFADKRYIIGEGSVRRNEAQKRCVADGRRLVTLTNVQDLEDLEDFMDNENLGDYFWIGGLFSDTEQCRGGLFDISCWYWDEQDGSRPGLAPELEGFFTNDALNGYPSRSSALTSKKGIPMQLDYDARSEILPFVCEQKVQCVCK